MSKLFVVIGGLVGAVVGNASAAESLLPEHVGIVPARNAEGFMPGCSMSGQLQRPDAYWTPSEKQVLAIEQWLPSQLDILNERGDMPIKLSLKGYARQYAGAMYGNRSLYYVFFFPIPEEPYSLSHPYQVCDGGPKYWAMLFDGATLTFGEPIFSTAYTRSPPVEKPAIPKSNWDDI